MMPFDCRGMWKGPITANSLRCLYREGGMKAAYPLYRMECSVSRKHNVFYDHWLKAHKEHDHSSDAMRYLVPNWRAVPLMSEQEKFLNGDWAEVDSRRLRREDLLDVKRQLDAQRAPTNMGLWGRL